MLGRVPAHGQGRVVIEHPFEDFAVCQQLALAKAIQTHGAGGLSQDFPLAEWSAGVRTLRFADGPDEVHKNALARNELKKWR